MTNKSKRDEFWKGVPKPVLAWAAVDRKGNIMPASVRDSIQGVKLACGECVPFQVLITYSPEAEIPIID